MTTQTSVPPRRQGRGGDRGRLGHRRGGGRRLRARGRARESAWTSRAEKAEAVAEPARARGPQAEAAATALDIREGRRRPGGVRGVPRAARTARRRGVHAQHQRAQDDARLQRGGVRPRRHAQPARELQRAARGGPHHDDAAAAAASSSSRPSARWSWSRARPSTRRPRPASSSSCARPPRVRAERRARERGGARGRGHAADRAHQGQPGVVRRVLRQDRARPLGARRRRSRRPRCSWPPDAASYVTGTVLFVDGGWTAAGRPVPAARDVTDRRARHRIAVIPGDGIGHEVIPAGARRARAPPRRALRLRGSRRRSSRGAARYYARTGRMMDADGLERLRGVRRDLLRARSAHPSVPDHVSVWELILPIRQRFDQYVNLRPMRLLPGVAGPLAGRGPRRRRHGLRARELGGGVLRASAGALHAGTADEMAQESGVFTRRGIERVVRYAFELAARAAPPAAGQRHEVQRAAAFDGAVGRGGGGGRRREYPRGGACAGTTWTRWRRAWSTHPQTARRDRGLEPVRRHPDRPRRGHRRAAWASRPGANINPERGTRRCSSPSTAPRPTSRAAASPTRSPRSGRGR